jgi:hypothetical protein
MVDGMEVEGLYDQDGEGKWYPGKVVGDKKEDGNWEVHFEDGDIFPYKGLDKDLRLAVSGSWKKWLDVYLLPLLTSAYRAARRECRMADLDPVLHPEQFDDAASGAGTPGPAAASRRGR